MRFLLIIGVFVIRILICSLNPNDYQMVVTYGKPLNYSTPTVYSISFEDCVAKCWADTTCVLVYDASPTCQMFVLANITTVQKLNSTSNERIAFRTYSTASTCPKTSTTPILIGGSVTGNTYYMIGQMFPAYQEFNITLSTKTNIWTFTTSIYFTCYMGYQPVKRGEYIMCMSVTLGTTCMNRTQATTSCAYMPSNFLLGIASMEEYEYIKSVAIGYLSEQQTSINYTRIGYWMDGNRTSTCKYPTTKSASCNGTNEFSYSDISASSPQFDWLPGQPNGLSNKPPDSNCLILRISAAGDNGVDDIPCSGTGDTTLDSCNSGYICGGYAAAIYL